MFTKNCSNFNCTQQNPQIVTRFYKHKTAKNGLRGECKNCRKIYDGSPSRKIANNKNRQKFQTKQRIKKYKQIPEVKEKAREYSRTSKARESQKIRQSTFTYKRNQKLYHQDPDNKKIARSKRLTKFWTNCTPNQAYDNYEKLLVAQNNVCAICQKPETTIDKNKNAPRSLAVDHCHSSGMVRGLLCGSCNKGLGLFKDNTELLNSAKKYLIKSKP
jgi:hypothetical protein